jgi:hypothetical protein
MLTVSCAKKTEFGNTNANTGRTTDINILNFNLSGNRSEEEKIRDLLLAQAERATKYNETVLSIKKVNFGLSGGDNWLVEWGKQYDISTLLLLYLIKDDIILKYYNFGSNFNMLSETSFDIMKDIPGAHIGKGTSSIGDFNSDGLDEIFQYGFFGYGKTVHVYGYGVQEDDVVFYCSIPFQLVDPENGPAPVEFITYKGMEGFKVYYVQLRVSGGPGYVPEPMPDNNKWFFYTWDSEKRGYIRVEEIVE